MKTYRIIAAFALALMLFAGCKKDEVTENKLPEVKTYEALEVTTNSAIITGEVLNENGTAVTIRGFCVSDSPDPGLDDLVLEANFGPGQFDKVVSGLASGTTYYFRAFATNAAGTAFGEELTFTTLESPVVGNPMIVFKTGSHYLSSSGEINVHVPVLIGINGTKNETSTNYLSRFKFVVTSYNVPTTIIDTTFHSSNFSWESELVFNTPGDCRLTFTLWDEGGFKDEISIDITVIDPGVAVHKYSNIELGSFNDATGGFFSTTSGTVYTPGQLVNSPNDQALIDFLFFKGITDYNCIASPDNADANSISAFQLTSWTTKNQTRFNTTNLTVAQFNEIGTNYLFPAFSEGNKTSKVNNLEEGDVILFKTEAGKLGLISIVDLFSRGDVAIIDVIIQD